MKKMCFARVIGVVFLFLLAALFLFSACDSDPVTYTITFVQSGVEDITRTVKSGESCTDIPLPQDVTGYTVTWEDADLSDVQSDMTINAVLTPIPYAIIYHLDGGENGANPAFYTIESAVTFADPKKDGYTFGGWFSNAATDGEVISGIPTGETGEKQVFAKWINNEAALVFHGNGATSGAMLAKQVTKDVSAELPQNAFVKDGYTFCGWAMTADGEVVCTDQATFTPSGFGPYALYAVWQANQNTLAFHANGADGTMQPLSLFTDENTTLPQNTFVRAGYTFCGWATSETGAVAYTDVASFTMGPQETITLYAVWQANQNTLVFHANGAESGTMQPLPLSTDEIITLPQNTFVRAGYTFCGWATSETGAVAYTDGASFTMGPQETITLYAVWEMDVYTISYRLGEGETNDSQNPTTFTIHDLPITLAAAQKEDAIFGGWFTDEGRTAVITQITEAKDYELFTDWGGLYFEYFVNAEMVYTITGYYGKLTTLEIPSEYMGEPVGRIAAEAFKDCTTLISVTIPETVSYVGADAFLGCPCIEVENGVKYVDTWAVGATDEWLGKVIFRDGTVGLAQYAFSGRMDVLQITFPQGFQHLDSQALLDCNRFVECYNLSGYNHMIGYDYVTGTISDSVHLSAEEESYLEKDGDYYFTTKNGDIALLCYVGSAETLTLPETYKGQSYRMSPYAFWRNPTLRRVKLPSTLTTIPFAAFSGCPLLEEVDLAQVSQINNAAFSGCPFLASITIPSTVTTIEDGAFGSCDHLVEVYNLSNLAITCGSSTYGSVAYYAKVVHTDATVESVVEHTADGLIFCSVDDTNYLVAYVGTATTLTLPQDYKGGTYEILPNAFRGQSALTDITIPDWVSGIADELFSGTNVFEEENGIIYVDKWAVDIADRSLTALVFRAGTIGIADNAFAGMLELTEVVFPDGMKWIGKSAFYGSYQLLRVTFPKSVQTVGKQAFQDCFKLMEIYKEEGASITFGEWWDRNSPVWKTHQTLDEESILDIVDGYVFATREEEPYLIGYVGDAQDLVLPGGYKGEPYVIFANAFHSKRGIRSVVLPDDVLRIQIDAFAHSSVQSVIVGKNITKLTSGMFASCTGLTSVTLSGNLTILGEAVFSGCTALESIVLPINIEQVDARAFYQCENLTIYYQGASIPTSWHDDWNRSGCPIVCSYQNITTDETFDYVISGDKAYITKYKGTETTVVVPATLGEKPVVDIANIFTGNTTIVSVELPSTIAFLRASAFKGCTALESITLPETMTSIGAYAFYRCLALKSIKIPTGVTVILTQTFSICQSLTSVTIPNTVTEIEAQAFYGCSALETIFVPASVTIMGDRVFWSCNKLTIYCEVAKQPSSWSIEWNVSVRPVKWGQEPPETSDT